MEFGEISVLARLVMGAVASFFAILLWSKTRDAAWILIILGTLFSYAEIIFGTLESFGILGELVLSIAGLQQLPVNQIIRILLVNLPLLLYTLAFILLILRRRLP